MTRALVILAAVAVFFLAWSAAGLISAPQQQTFRGFDGLRGTSAE